MGRMLLAALTIVIVGMFMMPGKALAHSGDSLDQPLAAAQYGDDLSPHDSSGAHSNQAPAIITLSAPDHGSHKCPGGNCCSHPCCGTPAAIGAAIIFPTPCLQKTAFALPPPQLPVPSACSGQFRPPESLC